MTFSWHVILMIHVPLASIIYIWCIHIYGCEIFRDSYEMNTIQNAKINLLDRHFCFRFIIRSKFPCLNFWILLFSTILNFFPLFFFFFQRFQQFFLNIYWSKILTPNDKVFIRSKVVANEITGTKLIHTHTESSFSSTRDKIAEQKK